MSKMSMIASGLHKPVKRFTAPLTAVEARTATFRTRRWRTGLDIESVDELMDEVIKSVDPTSTAEDKLSSVQIVEGLDKLKPARWWQRGYDPIDVYSFGLAAIDTVRSLEDYLVVSQAESILAESAGDDDGGTDSDPIEGELRTLASGFIALGDLTKSKIDDLESELTALRKQVNGRLH